MTSIDRTAYPRFKRQPTTKELAEWYTPSPDELTLARSRTSSHSGLFGFLVLLKSFQRLGYFPHPELIPVAVINHLRSWLKLPPSASAIPPLRSRRRYEQAIRAFLQVKPYDRAAQQLAATTITDAAQTKEHPADLINIAIEALVKERYELPAFSTLERLVGNIRSIVNTRLFQQVTAKLSTTAPRPPMRFASTAGTDCRKLMAFRKS